MANYQELANLVWNVADDVLRGLFKPHEYGDITLPFLVLRRLDCILEEDGRKEKAINTYNQFKDQVSEDTLPPIILRAINTSFYNTSQYDLSRLRADPTISISILIITSTDSVRTYATSSKISISVGLLSDYTTTTGCSSSAISLRRLIYTQIKWTTTRWDRFLRNCSVGFWRCRTKRVGNTIHRGTSCGYWSCCCLRNTVRTCAGKVLSVVSSIRAVGRVAC